MNYYERSELERELEKEQTEIALKWWRALLPAPGLQKSIFIKYKTYFKEGLTHDKLTDNDIMLLRTLHITTKRTIKDKKLLQYIAREQIKEMFGITNLQSL